MKKLLLTVLFFFLSDAFIEPTEAKIELMTVWDYANTARDIALKIKDMVEGSATKSINDFRVQAALNTAQVLDAAG